MSSLTEREPMTFSSIVQKNLRGAVRIDEAEQIVGGQKILELVRKAGWLKPAIQEHRLTLFDYDEVMEAWKRVKIEGYQRLTEAANAAR